MTRREGRLKQGATRWASYLGPHDELPAALAVDRRHDPALGG